MDKVKAARQAKGLIMLEDTSAEHIKQAIQKVSTITNTQGNEVSFEGERIAEGAGFALKINCFDIYHCPNGYLLHTYMDNAPNWAVTGKTLEAMLDVVPMQVVAGRVHGLLVQKNLLSGGH